MTSTLTIGRSFLAFWILMAITSHASWALLNPNDRPYTYSPSLGVGYNLNVTELPGTASLVHGPMVNFKYTIENNGVFMFPDASAGILLGLEKSLAMTYSLGIGLGVVDENKTGFWGGAKLQSILDYKTTPGTIFRVGMFFENDSKRRIDLELNYGNMPEELSDATRYYSVFGILFTYGLL